MKAQYKIKYTSEELPKDMWVIGEEFARSILFAITDYSGNFKENYLMLFKTERDALDYIVAGNKEEWFALREYKPYKINTTLKKYKSRYVPLGVGIANFYK